MVRKKIASALIVSGMLVFFYPLLSHAFTCYWQQRIFNEWEESLAGGESFPSEKACVWVWEPEKTQESGEAAMEEKKAPGLSFGLEITPLGILEIAKIDLRIPILKGASLANLRIGAGLLEEMAGIGEPGNTVLMAHRSYTYGYFFNRLDEIGAGDEIVIIAPKDICRYLVYNKVIVEPDNISSVCREQGDETLTLVTCHPIRNATHRLIIQAQMIGKDTGEKTEGHERRGAK